MDDNHPFYQKEYVVMIVQFYSEGMAIEDISMCLGLSTRIVNTVLDRVVPYLGWE